MLRVILSHLFICWSQLDSLPAFIGVILMKFFVKMTSSCVATCRNDRVLHCLWSGDWSDGGQGKGHVRLLPSIQWDHHEAYQRHHVVSKRRTSCTVIIEKCVQLLRPRFQNHSVEVKVKTVLMSHVNCPVCVCVFQVVLFSHELGLSANSRDVASLCVYVVDQVFPVWYNVSDCWQSHGNTRSCDHGGEAWLVHGDRGRGAGHSRVWNTLRPVLRRHQEEPSRLLPRNAPGLGHCPRNCVQVNFSLLHFFRFSCLPVTLVDRTRLRMSLSCYFFIISTLYEDANE